MRTHFEPHLQYDDAEQAICGTWFSEASNTTGDWRRVDCRKCLKLRAKITKSVEAEERAIVDQMGEMAAFMESAQPAAE